MQYLWGKYLNKQIAVVNSLVFAPLFNKQESMSWDILPLAWLQYLLIWAALGRLHCSLLKWSVSVFFNVLFVSRSTAEPSTPIRAFMGWQRSHANLPCLVNLEYGTQAICGQHFLSLYEKSCAKFLQKSGTTWGWVQNDRICLFERTTALVYPK